MPKILPELQNLTPSEKNEVLTPDRVWTICELIIYRYRDEHFLDQSVTRLVLTEIADQIQNIRQKWEKNKNE